MKYLINYGGGIATLYTPEADWKSRFTELAGSCWGIRKSILCVELMGRSDEEPTDKQPEEHERLDFGDVYIWRRDGARKMIEPEMFADEDWDESYCRNTDEAAEIPSFVACGDTGEPAEGRQELAKDFEERAFDASSGAAGRDGGASGASLARERSDPADSGEGAAASPEDRRGHGGDINTDGAAAVRRIIERLGAEELFLRLRGVCPCCGGVVMRDTAAMNALSRHADAYICSGCGKSEALRDAAGLAPKPLGEWKIAMFARVFFAAGEEV